ncbi:MAG: superoxide dismutase family protein [Gemmatimonadota bacterium]|nr:superoxide dismutase family protein [Gemmatimonadota bacterium]
MMRPILLALSLASLACATAGAGPSSPADITVRLQASDGRAVGTAVLHQSSQAVTIRFRLTDLPAGPHGAHVHAVGRCDPPAFTTAGGHLNPMQRKHGHRSPDGWHLGDLANIIVAADGRADTTITVADATLAAGSRSLLGPDGRTALVLHEKADDEMTDPSGNAGARIACGVIQR